MDTKPFPTGFRIVLAGVILVLGWLFAAMIPRDYTIGKDWSFTLPGKRLQSRNRDNIHTTSSENIENDGTNSNVSSTSGKIPFDVPIRTKNQDPTSTKTNYVVLNGILKDPINNQDPPKSNELTNNNMILSQKPSLNSVTEGNDSPKAEWGPQGKEAIRIENNNQLSKEIGATSFEDPTFNSKDPLSWNDPLKEINSTKEKKSEKQDSKSKTNIAPNLSEGQKNTNQEDSKIPMPSPATNPLGGFQTSLPINAENNDTIKSQENNENLDKRPKKVETPVKTTDESVKKVETPVKTTDESVKKVETPVKTTDEPVKKVETPVKPTDESVKKVETPVKPTDEPVKKAETPVKPTDEPVKKAETPVKTTDGPVKKVETPVKTTDKPVKKVETPVKTTDELVKKVETPVKTMDELVKKVETPVKTTDESVKKVDNMTKQADSVVKTTDNIIPSPVPANNITMVFKESPVVDTLKEDTLKKATLKTDSILQKPLENKTAKPVTENQANTDGKTSGDNSVSKENQVMVQTDIPKNRIDLKVSPSEQVNVGTSNLLKSQTIPAPLPLVEQTKPIDQQKKTVVTTKPDIKGTKKIEPLPLKNNTGDTKEEPLAIKKESKGNENMASLKPNLEDPAKMQQMTTNTVLLKPSVPSLARQNNPSQPEQDLSNPKKITVLRPSISSIQRQKDTKDTPSTPAGDSLQMKNKNSISLPKALRTHTVKSNDTDESLRKQYKWNESQFSVFLSLNKGKKDVKGQYAVGTILSIP